MKKLLSILSVMLLLWGCYPAKTTVSGLENVSFVELYGPKNTYKNMVDVYVDDQPSFKATVNIKGKNTTKIANYQIPTGKHTIKVEYEGKVLYNSEVFLSSQITKKISLP